MEKEYTNEESDALILQEMGIAEENSTTNNNEVETEEEVETQDVETETEEETEDEEQEQEIEEVTSKPKKGIVKVLHQRNEARKEAEDAKSQVQVLQSKLDELEADGNYGNEEYIQTLVDKRMAEADEKQEYFDNNENIKPYKRDILNYARETGLSLERATKLYLAENKPDLLLEPQTLNKQKSKMYNTPSVTSKKLISGKFEYTDKEFEEKAKRGEITF